jgi:hypothetical protein
MIVHAIRISGAQKFIIHRAERVAPAWQLKCSTKQEMQPIPQPQEAMQRPTNSNNALHSSAAHNPAERHRRSEKASRIKQVRLQLKFCFLISPAASAALPERD